MADNPETVEALTSLMQAGEGLINLIMIGVIALAVLWLTSP